MNGLGKTAGSYRALLLCALMLTGCANLKVPAIDPSGQRIFLPAPASTTLVPSLPQPAFKAPPQPPPCPDAVVAAPTLPGSLPTATPLGVGQTLVPQSRPGELVLTPTRVVAPIGSEVLLAAGLTGAAGALLPGQQIEWLLSQDSVGYFVEVGGAEAGYFGRFLSTPPRKLSSNYAIGHTLAAAQLLTRGTATSVDDIWLQRGQSWISVSSATEGTSHVSVLATNARSWDRRPQSAAIYWIDAQWSLPPPANVRAGQSHVLSTTLTRASNGTPLTGWLVSYAIADGSAAGFAPSGAAAVEVAADATGRADVELVPQTDRGGTSQIQIQIIRAAQGSGDMPRIVVGQGFTTVTWSSPGLAVQMSGPESANVDSNVTYRVEVSNPGDMTSSNVTLDDVIPPSLTYVSSTPPGQPFGNRIQWRLGDLPAQSTSTVEITCRTLRNADLRNCVTVQSAEGLVAEACVATRIFTPSLSLRMTGPSQAEVGSEVEFRIEVGNVGKDPLTNVTLTDRFDAGLEHSEQQLSPIQVSLGNIAAGLTVRRAIKFQVKQPGQWCHTLEANADGGEMATAKSCITATPPPFVGKASIAVSKRGPGQQYAGATAEYFLDVVNTGNVPLTNVRIVDNFDAELEPKLATDGFQRQQRDLIWTIAELAVGEKQTRQVNCLCLQPADAAINRVTVGCDQNITASDQTSTRILPAPAATSAPPEKKQPADVKPPRETKPPPADVKPPPAVVKPPVEEPQIPVPPVSGELRVAIADQADPIRVGQRTTYLIVVQNDRNVTDKSVTLTLIIPEGLRFEKLSGPAGARSTSPDGRTVEVASIAELRVGETLPPFRVEITALRPGKFRFRVELQSLRTPTPIQAEEETTVNVE